MSGASRKFGSHKFGSYVLGPRLGVGGMAAAYEALKQGPGGFEQRVCLKRVLPVYRDDPDFRRLFMREATIAASLRHSNIVGVIDFGEVDDEPYLTLELIDGLDLRTLVRAQEGRRLPGDEVLLVGIEITRALEYAHNVRHEGGTGVLHRDISPSNVLVSTSGEIKLGDFGIAKLMGSAGATASAALRGKLSYLAPETAEGDNVDARADIFALGVMLYELCHGHRPFDGSNDSQTFAAIQSGEARPWNFEAGPAGLEKLVMSMIARNPDDRPRKTENLLEALTTVRKELSDYGDLSPRRSIGARVRELQAERGQDAEEQGDEEHGTEALNLKEAHDSETAAPPALAKRASPDDPTKTQLGSAGTETAASAETTEYDTADPDARESNTHERATHLLAQNSSPPAAQRKWLWPVVIVAAIALAGFLFSTNKAARSSQPATTQDAARPDEEKIAAPATPIEEPIEASQADAATDAASALDATAPDAGESNAQRPPSQSRVHVTVVPWGNIWIDGVRHGRAPRWVTLPPGMHRISGGRSTIEETRSIRVHEGKSRRVLIELGAP